MSVNYSGNNPYKVFFQQTGVYNPVNNAESKTGQKPAPQQTMASVMVGDVSSDNEKNNNSGRRKLFGIIGISAGSVLLLGIIGLFTLSKGFSGNVARRLTKISEDAKKKIYELTAQSKELTSSQKMKLKIHKTVQHGADALQASSNISAVKDSLMLHMLKKLHIDSAIDKINNVFKKITLKTKNNSYKTAEYSVIDFCNYLKDIAKQKNSPELAQKAKQIMSEYMRHFSSEQHIKRSENAWQKMSGLHDEVFNALFKKEGGFFRNLKQMRSYVTTDLIAKDRKVVFDNVNASKAKISNSLSDVNTNIKQALNNLKISVNPNNKKAVNIVKEISSILESHRALSGTGEKEGRKILFGKIQLLLDELATVAGGDIKSKEALKLANERIERLRAALSENSYSKGYAQEAVTTVKHLFEQEGGRNSEAYKKAVKYLEKMNTDLNTAIRHENNAYEKLAELRVGSAPADILGILGPTVLGTALVVNSKDTDERISKTLTQGIPILGGVATTYYGTTRGFTGAKNLILGLVTGWVLNVIGSKTDELVKKYRVEQNKLKAAFESFTKLQTQKKTPEQNTQNISESASV